MIKDYLEKILINQKNCILYKNINSKDKDIILKTYPDVSFDDVIAIKKISGLLNKKIYVYTHDRIYLSAENQIFIVGLKSIEKVQQYYSLIYEDRNETMKCHEDIASYLLKVSDYYHQFYHEGNEYFDNKDYIKALEKYNLAISLKNKDAMIKKAKCFEQGLGVTKDIDKAIELYKKTIKEGNKDDYYDKGKELFHQKEYVHSYVYLLKANALQHDYASYYLAQIYHYGLCYNKDIRQAEKLYKKILENHDDQNVHYHLTKLYRDKKDYDKMLEHLEKCDEKKTYYLKGKLYQKGIGVKKDLTKAKEYYKLSIPYMNKAYFALASISLEQKSYDEYFNYLNESDKHHDKRAKNQLGLAYERGRGISKDYQKALYYYNEAIKDNIPHAYFNLARMYRDGKGVKKDINEAIRLFEVAASLNHGGAYSELGKMYINGTIEKDIDKGVEYVEKGIELDSENAKVYMATLCIEGKYVKEDVYYAYDLLNDAMLKETNGFSAKKAFIRQVLNDVFHITFDELSNIFLYALEVKQEEKDFEKEFLQLKEYYKKEFIKEYIIGCAYDEDTNALFLYKDEEQCYFIDIHSYEDIIVPFSKVKKFKDDCIEGTPVNITKTNDKITGIHLSYEDFLK